MDNNWLQQTSLLFIKAVDFSNKLQNKGNILRETTVKNQNESIHKIHVCQFNSSSIFIKARQKTK